MSNIASIILVSIYLCIRGLRAHTDAAYPRCDAMPRVQNALEKYGLKLDAVLLLGHVPTQTERVRVSRALVELEWNGLIERVRKRRSRRTSRIKLTSYGESAAEQILNTPPGEIIMLPITLEEIEAIAAEKARDGAGIVEEGSDGNANDEC